MDPPAAERIHPPIPQDHWNQRAQGLFLLMLNIADPTPPPTHHLSLLLTYYHFPPSLFIKTYIMKRKENYSLFLYAAYFTTSTKQSMLRYLSTTEPFKKL